MYYMINKKNNTNTKYLIINNDYNNNKYIN